MRTLAAVVALVALSSSAFAAPLPAAGVVVTALTVCTEAGINRFMAEGEVPIANAQSKAAFDAAQQARQELMGQLTGAGACVFLAPGDKGFRVSVVKPLTYYIPKPSQNAVAAVQVVVLDAPAPYDAWSGRDAATLIYLPMALYDGHKIEFVDHWPPPAVPGS